MRLKSVEIHGFKSFPDKTKLEFNQPITAVVGPNGSGKSNIGDAIRWVLGEQSSKTLRGNKMEDVIFDGTQQRKEQGFASVALTIENQERTMDVDADEVIISRKIYRSGESEYRINGAEVRLKDVHQLFMDTGLGRDGYSIIGQGKIAEIISAKSKERREMFEEAAGIAKYRYHKLEAQRRLENAEENLERLKDILSELEVRIEPLRKDSEKAANFIVLAQEKKTLEISLWMGTIERSKVAIKEQEDKIYLLQGEYEEVEEKLEQIEEEINALFAQMQNCSVEMDNARLSIKNLEEKVSQLHARKAVAENNAHHNEQSLAEFAREMEMLGETKQNISEDLEQKKQQETEKKQEYEELFIQLKDKKTLFANNSVKLKDITHEIEHCKARRTAIYAELNETRIRSATSATVLEQSQKRLLEIAQENQRRAETLKQLQSEVEECEQLIATVEEQYENLQNAENGYVIKLESRKEKQQQLTETIQKIGDEIRQKRQRAKLLEDMENSLEGFSHSVKFLHKAAKAGELIGVKGTVSSVLRVDTQFSLAMETALGAAMQNIIVQDEFIAKQAIAHLSKHKAGRATFLPLTTIRGNALDIATIKEKDRCIGVASELIRYDKEYDGIVKNLLGRIVVVKDLDTATDVAKANGYKFRIVTLDGQVIHAGGSFTGGSQVQSAGILSRRAQVEELHTEANTLLHKQEKLEQEMTLLLAEMSAFQAQVDAIESEKSVATEDKREAQSELRRLQYTRDDIQNSEKIFLEEKKQLETQLASLGKADMSIAMQVKDLEMSLGLIEEKIATHNANTQSISVENNEISQKISQMEIALVSLQKDQDMLQQLCRTLLEQEQTHYQRKRDIEEKQAVLMQNNLRYREESKRCEEESIEFREEIEQLQKKISVLVQQRTEKEKLSTELRGGTRDIISAKEKLSAEITRLEERKISLQHEYDGIIAKLWDEYQLTRSQAQEFTQEVLDFVEGEKRLISLKNSIRALGNVNLGAIEEYKEVGERYHFLKAQLQDVEQSRTQLNRLISDLTTQMQEIFSRQFDLINANFSRIFVELFGGGKAELSLTDSEDVLESGIDIYVQPPGKLIKNLSALSGGEQAFVAIAIYFAILHVNPSPFCILDEIEAALDDVNVTKYAQYLRKLSDKTQFIAISHRRGTMEEADVLYGVTMQEEGVSKLLTLQVAEIEERLGMKAGEL